MGDGICGGLDMNKALENYECDGQLSFAPNGNISPCPYIRDCNTYGIGCQGALLIGARDSMLRPTGKNLSIGTNQRIQINDIFGFICRHWWFA
jgi:hypothetical protein